MGILDGPVALTKFLGATVTGMEAVGQWNEQSTTVTVSLVEDLAAGDRYMPPAVGRPVRFALGGFSYEGLLQSSQRKMDLQGNPTFEATITDPTEVLAGCVVMLDSLVDPVALPNFLNVYGFWENRLGFGGSMANESGMLWEAPFEILNLDSGSSHGITITPDGVVGIAPALEFLTRNPGNYGGPIQFRGYSYSLDLGGLPSVPAYYRLGGTARSVLELVTELCQDAGCDYMCYLDGFTIRFKVVSRRSQPSLGQIANFIAGQPDATSRAYGTELRNDYTNAILIGSNVLDLVTVLNPGNSDAIWPYWGRDVLGNVIVGHGQPEDKHTFNLNASEVSDVVGDVVYECDLVELRCALADYESWAAYVLITKPDVAETLDIACTIDSTSDLATLFPDVLFRRDLIAMRKEDVDKFGMMNDSDYWSHRVQRLYDFIARYAGEYFGSKFLVRIPFFIFWRTVPETTTVVATEEIADAAYTPEFTQPLGLSFENVDFALNDQGLFECFVGFNLDPLMDLQKLSPGNFILQGNTVYMRATVDKEIVYTPESIYPYCVVTLAEPIYGLMPDPLGGIPDIAQILGVDPAQILEYAAGIRHGSFPMRITPAPYRPAGAVVPMRSNRRCYGPWGTFPNGGGTQGVPGKVYVEVDDSMNPWTYGDWNTLNLAAMAKLSNAATAMQEAETGTAEVPGTPGVQIGDAIAAGGPAVTGISCRFGVSGVTTSYSMRTYTPTFGAFARSNADRLKRLGTAALQVRKALRNLFNRQKGLANVFRSAQAGFMVNAAHAVLQETPHDVILATMTKSDKYGYRTQVSLSTIDELLANMRGDHQPTYFLTGGMGLEGLYHPFSTATGEDEDGDPDAGDMPHFEEPDEKIPSDSYHTKAIHPFKDSNIDIVINGEEYDEGVGIHAIKGEIDPDTIRGVGFRLPMVGVGWGMEYTGKPLPNKSDESLPLQSWEDEWADEPAKHPERFRAGNIALHWDVWRKVWTVPTVLRGTLAADLTDDAGDEGVLMKIEVIGQELDDRVKVYNDLGGGTIASGTKVAAHYYPLENKWYVVAAACTS